MPSKSVKQQRLMFAAQACQKGKGRCTGAAGKVAKTMSPKQVRDFTKLKKR